MINAVHLINQLFEIQSKIRDMGEADRFERNFTRLTSMFTDEGYIVQDPTHEAYSDSRTDCEASITGKMSSRMKISKTLKPVIYQKEEGNLRLVQKAVVIVENE